MAVEYNRTTEHLSKLVKKLEHILTLQQICRKFETIDEKIVPFSIPIEIETENLSTSSNWKRTGEVIFSLSSIPRRVLGHGSVPD